jgi:hypothetical protein
MKNKRVILTFLVVVLLLVPFAVFGATLHVGPGQTYNGTTQDAINRAIQAANSGDTVYLHAATYNITKPIIMKSGITLRGDGNNTVIHGAGSNVCNNPSNEREAAYIVANDVSNVTICYLRFTSTATSTNDGGHGDGRQCIWFRRASNCTVHNVTFTRFLYCDGVRVSKSNGITVRDCEINAGHDGICFYASSNCKAYNNLITVQTNNAIRIYSSSNVEIYKNNFTTYAGGWCVLQFEENARNVDVHHNVFYDTKGNAGLAPWKFSGSNIQVHDNVFWNCTTITKESEFKGQLSFASSNQVNPSDRNLTNWKNKGYGRGSSGSGSVSGGSNSNNNSNNNSNGNNNNNSSNNNSSNNNSNSSNNSSSSKNNNNKSSNQGNSSQSSGYISPEIRNMMMQDRYNGLIQRIQALQGNNSYYIIPSSSKSTASKNTSTTSNKNTTSSKNTSSSKNNTSNVTLKNGNQTIIVPNLTNQDLYGRFAR